MNFFAGQLGDTLRSMLDLLTVCCLVIALRLAVPLVHMLCTRGTPADVSMSIFCVFWVLGEHPPHLPQIAVANDDAIGRNKPRVWLMGMLDGRYVPLPCTFWPRLPCYVPCLL